MSEAANGYARSLLMNLGNVLLLLVCVLLCGYLLYALLKPEDF
jgi:K+-transporting ATPase KdpF subunit